MPEENPDPLQDPSFYTAQQEPEELPDLKADLVPEQEEEEGLDCPYCDNNGVIVEYYRAPDGTVDCDPEQCEFCYTEPNSKFNVGLRKHMEENQSQDNTHPTTTASS